MEVGGSGWEMTGKRPTPPKVEGKRWQNVGEMTGDPRVKVSKGWWRGNPGPKGGGQPVPRSSTSARWMCGCRTASRQGGRSGGGGFAWRPGITSFGLALRVLSHRVRPNRIHKHSDVDPGAQVDTATSASGPRPFLFGVHRRPASGPLPVRVRCRSSHQIRVRRGGQPRKGAGAFGELDAVRSGPARDAGVVWSPAEERLMTRPGRVRFFTFYRVGRARRRFSLCRATAHGLRECKSEEKCPYPRITRMVCNGRHSTGSNRAWRSCTECYGYLRTHMDSTFWVRF
eukprot:gene21255-biopygen5653